MIKLSGGQRARLSLARAVYARTDLCVAWLSYIIDKSTNTSVIGSYLMIVLLPWTVMSPAMSLVCSLFKLAGPSMLNVLDNVIGPQGLLASKARIFVTNSIAFVRQFDHLVYLRHGYVIESGSYYELVANSDSEISKLMYAIRFERCNVSLTFSSDVTMGSPVIHLVHRPLTRQPVVLLLPERKSLIIQWRKSPQLVTFWKNIANEPVSPSLV